MPFVIFLALYDPHRRVNLIFDPDDLSTDKVSILVGVGRISDGLFSPSVFSGVDS